MFLLCLLATVTAVDAAGVGSDGAVDLQLMFTGDAMAVDPMLMMLLLADVITMPLMT